MKKLIILRHAHAVHDGTADFKRSLTKEGEEEASAAGKTLKKNGLIPDMIISSPAERAAQTAKKVARKLDFPENRIVFDREVYSADEYDMLQILQHIDDSCKALMIVGHNPTLLHLAINLMRKPFDTLPPGGIIVIEFHKGLSWAELKNGSGKSAIELNF
ncbi:MAG: SixA phosphatase family protein [Victivallaceae bacterium]